MTALVEPEIVQQRATWKPCTPDRATSSTKFTNVKTQFLQWPHLCEHSIFHNIASCPSSSSTYCGKWKYDWSTATTTTPFYTPISCPTLAIAGTVNWPCLSGRRRRGQSKVKEY